MAQIKTTDIINGQEVSAEIQKVVTALNTLMKQLGSLSVQYQKTNGSTKELTELQKKNADYVKNETKAMKDAEAAQKSLAKQRQAGLAAMAKAEAKQRDLVKAATMEAKTDQQLIQKLNALKTLRGQVDKSTAAGTQKYKEMTASIQKLDAQVKANAKSQGEYNRNVGNYPKVGAAMVAGFMAAYAAAQKVYAAVKESIDLFIEQEKQSFRVKQAFGDYAGVINDAADANQNMTTVGNEQYQKLAVLAHSYGVANRDVNETVKQSIGLSTMFEAAGIGQEQAMQMLVKAQNGQYMSLKRVIPEIAQAKNQQEALEIINRKAAEGYAVASKYAETYGGRLEQIKNASGDLKETIGEGVLTGLFTTDEAGKTVNIINELNKALAKSGIVKEYFKGVSDLAKMIFEPIEKIAKAFGLATDGGSTLLLIFDGLVKWMEIMMIPAKMFWAQISNGVDIVIGLYNIFTNLKDFKIQDIFNIANKAITNLLEPITDLIGATDDVKKFFGVARDEIKLTREELDKINVLSGDYVANVKKMAKETIALNEELENENNQLEIEKDAIKKAEEAYKSYLDTITKINKEYQIMIEFLKSDADLKQAAIDRDQKAI
jgi:chromosome segregation ATPase